MRLGGDREARGGREARQRSGLTSLVDVVFLLLVFFLLAGTLRMAAPFDVTEPEGGGPRITGDARATIWLAADGRLALDDRPIELAELVARLSADDAATVAGVELRADESARARDLLPLLEQLRDAGIDEVELVVRERG